MHQRNATTSTEQRNGAVGMEPVGKEWGEWGINWGDGS